MLLDLVGGCQLVVDADVEPIVCPVYQHIIPGVLCGGAVPVDKLAVDHAAVKAQVAEKQRKEGRVVGAVAGALEHHFVGVGADVGVGIHDEAGIVVESSRGAGFLFQIPADQNLTGLDLLIVPGGKCAVAGQGDGAFVKIELAVPAVSDAVLDDPVVDRQNLLLRGQTVRGNFGQDLLSHIIGLQDAEVDGRPDGCGLGLDGHGGQEQADQQDNG